MKMKLADKILKLRKQHGMSQENLAEKLNLSRQTISRWEVGSAQPDAMNVLQLSKLFEVTADYLLNDDYESDQDVPAVNNTETAAKHKIRKIVALSVSAFGIFGNFTIYILSRFIKVMVPYMTYENGEKWYNWSSGYTGYSYKYFVQEYNMEFLTTLFLIFILGGLIVAFVPKETFKKAAVIIKNIRQNKEIK